MVDEDFKVFKMRLLMSSLDVKAEVKAVSSWNPDKIRMGEKSRSQGLV